MDNTARERLVNLLGRIPLKEETKTTSECDQGADCFDRPFLPTSWAVPLIEIPPEKVVNGDKIDTLTALFPVLVV